MLIKHFLHSWYEYANKRVDDVIASQFSINLVHKNDENPIFQPRESKTCLISTLYKCKWFALIYFDMGTCLSKNENFHKFYIQNMWKKWSDDINSLICIFTSTVQEMFHWNLRNLSYFYPIKKKKSRFFFFFYSFYRIDLNLDWF